MSCDIPNIKSAARPDCHEGKCVQTSWVRGAGGDEELGPGQGRGESASSGRVCKPPPNILLSRWLKRGGASTIARPKESIAAWILQGSHRYRPTCQACQSFISEISKTGLSYLSIPATTLRQPPPSLPPLCHIHYLIHDPAQCIEPSSPTHHHSFFLSASLLSMVERIVRPLPPHYTASAIP